MLYAFPSSAADASCFPQALFSLPQNAMHRHVDTFDSPFPMRRQSCIGSRFCGSAIYAVVAVPRHDRNDLQKLNAQTSSIGQWSAQACFPSRQQSFVHPRLQVNRKVLETTLLSGLSLRMAGRQLQFRARLSQDAMSRDGGCRDHSVTLMFWEASSGA